MDMLLLIAALVCGLILIPLGLPGLWVMVGAALVYSYVAPGRLGLVSLVVITAMAATAEVLELVLAGRYARKYGGSRRAGWGAMAGGLVGAIVGLPIPIVGSAVGAFAGAFAGAALAEVTRGTDVRVATRVATGALLGRIAAVAAKVAIGIALLAWVVLAALVNA